jgi:hypothetical protein
MSSKFPLAVKSTIDYVAMQIATPLNLAVVDMDAAGLFAELLESDDTAIVWAIGSLSEAPMDPLWYVDFDIGVKTSLDPAQYKSLDVLSVLTNTFKVGQQFAIKDYSGDEVGAQYGSLFISNVMASPSQPDRLSGIRLVNVQARAMRS